MNKKNIPVLPLRDIVVFPYMVAPLFVGRFKSINALETVMEENKEIVVGISTSMKLNSFLNLS